MSENVFNTYGEGDARLYPTKFAEKSLAEELFGMVPTEEMKRSVVIVKYNQMCFKLNTNSFDQKDLDELFPEIKENEFKQLFLNSIDFWTNDNLKFTINYIRDLYMFPESKMNLSLSSLKISSEKFFSSFFNLNVDWTLLCQLRTLSEKFFEKYIISSDNVNDDYTTNNPFPRDRVDWKSLCGNTNLSEAFFEKYINDPLTENKIYWPYLCYNTNLSDKFFEKYLSNPFTAYKIDWNWLCRNTNLSESFFEKNFLNIRWNWLSENKNISEAFFEKYLNYVVWPCLCKNTNISEKFFEKYISFVKWEYLCKNNNISQAFFEKYINKVIWSSLSQNKNITKEFVDKYAKLQKELNEKLNLQFKDILKG